MSGRSRIAAVLIGTLWVSALVRAAVVQTGGDAMRATANRQRVRTETLEATPGPILDRRGRPLAVSVRKPSLFVDPSRIDDLESASQLLAEATGLSTTKVQSRIGSDRDRKFAWLLRRCDPSIADAAAAIAGLPDQAVGVRQEWRRVYPLEDAAAHVLGLRGLDGEARGGIEELFSSRIAGVDGVSRTVVDARGRELSTLSEISSPPGDGKPIRLTIDSRIQTIASRRVDRLMTEWSPRWAAAILMDVQTGDLLAIASRPSYDANDPIEISAAGFHHAFRATFEPGSVIKPLVIAAALDAGVVSESSEIDCGPGRAVVGGRPMRDGRENGVLPLEDVISRSSNIGAARIAERLGAGRLEAALRAFGFGSRIALEIPVSETGLLRPAEQWSGYSLGSLAMGHELAVTPLHLATAYATLCRGTLMRPRLVLSDASTVETGRRVISDESSDWVISQAMRKAVEVGTAKRANAAGLSIFGKTGTAQKFDQEASRYSRRRATCVFCGGVPAEAPRMVIVVVADDPRPEDGRSVSGGAVSAPAARDVLVDAWRLFDEREATAQKMPN